MNPFMQAAIEGAEKILGLEFTPRERDMMQRTLGNRAEGYGN